MPTQMIAIFRYNVTSWGRCRFEPPLDTRFAAEAEGLRIDHKPGAALPQDKKGAGCRSNRIFTVKALAYLALSKDRDRLPPAAVQAH
jgi:hypothetical protein